MGCVFLLAAVSGLSMAVEQMRLQDALLLRLSSPILAACYFAYIVWRGHGLIRWFSMGLIALAALFAYWGTSSLFRTRDLNTHRGEQSGGGNSAALRASP